MTLTTDVPESGQTISQSAEALRLATEVLSDDGESIEWKRIAGQLDKPEVGLAELRHVLSCGSAALTQRFLNGETAGTLVHDRARLVDMIVLTAWRQTTAAGAIKKATLAAVGGYGRGELHPYSDVDLLILLKSDKKAAVKDPLARFLTLLWDIGLEVGHSTRTIAECKSEARGEISVITNLMEARYLAGDERLFRDMAEAVGPDKIWSSRSFFEAKLKEQHARHAGYDDTAYNLEPNVKGSPGGLRDIQMIVWVTQRHFGNGRLGELVEHNFLTPEQLRLLQQGREFLWRIRFALHVLTDRQENRLLFDYQTKIAELFGYRDATYMLAVEQLMQRYYRTVMDLSRLNEMLLQLFQEAILMNPDVDPEPLNERFQVKNGFLQITHDDVFANNPPALLELFLLLQQNSEIKGVSAPTITAIKRNLHLIDDEFRQDPRNHDLFLRIVRAPEGVTHELRRMNLYGVLGRYVPAFGRIVGRMQYDLFHTYTVDAHTLFVVSNLRRFALKRFDHEFPRCSEIMQALRTPEVTYLAGLFHDIAKGRGGDHSELGAVDAEAFCLEHGMPRYEARLVAWLVRHHLSLSLTAQKKDINDAAVVRDFAELVGDQLHLDYLYLLTVADVRATNPKLWNSWRAQLFEGLYSLTKQALRRGIENQIDKEELLKQRKEEARHLLIQSDLGAETVDAIWDNFTDEYFLRCRPDEIASHTRLFADPQNAGKDVMVDVLDQAFQGGTAIFLFTPQRKFAFAAATAALDELGLNIADARIIPLKHNRSLSTYVVLETTGEPIEDSARLKQVIRRLTHVLTTDADSPLTVSRRAPRQVRMFPTATLVTFTVDEANNRSVMELVTGDRPGLLCEVGQVMRKQRIKIQTAKILTVGERVEDVFYITGDDGNALNDEQCAALKQALEEALGQSG